MTSLKAFTKFPELPPEIQLQIWESTIATQPAMHLFDVCVPPCVSESTATTTVSPSSDSHNDNSEDEIHTLSKREAIYLEEATDTLYLSPLTTTSTEDAISTPGTDVSTQGARFRSDPSMYKFRSSLAATCIDAAATVRRSTTTACGGRGGSGAREGDTNTIYIGAPSTARGCASITYDNTQDVLYLRFTPPEFRFPDGGRLTSPLSAIFESVWSQELAGALHRARRVAIDVSQLWPDLWARGGAGAGGAEQQQGGGGEGEGEGVQEEAGQGDAGATEDEAEVVVEEEVEAGGNDDGSLIMQDIAFLACTMQHDLEVLYLVDYCAGRCDSCPSQPSSLTARDLMDRRDEGLYRALRNGETWQKEKMRKPDVIEGVGKAWREVFDLEKLGWDEEHPGFVFAEMFAEVVKMQQGNWTGDDSQDSDVAKERVKFQGVRVLVAEDEQDNGEDSSMLLRCDGHRHGIKTEDHDI